MIRALLPKSLWRLLGGKFCPECGIPAKSDASQHGLIRIRCARGHDGKAANPVRGCSCPTCARGRLATGGGLDLQLLPAGVTSFGGKSLLYDSESVVSVRADLRSHEYVPVMPTFGAEYPIGWATVEARDEGIYCVGMRVRNPLLTGIAAFPVLMVAVSPGGSGPRHITAVREIALQTEPGWSGQQPLPMAEAM